jgi:transposase InsO family protein
MDEQPVDKSLEPSILAESLPPNSPRNPPTSSKHNGPWQPDQRRQAVEAFHKSSMNIEDFARTWGVGKRSLSIWVKQYEREGPKGLERKHYKLAGRPRRAGMREEIAEVQRKYPDFGLRKVRDFLARFHGVRVSVGSVRNTLQERGVNTLRPRKRRKKIQPPRRFERAKAGELWQTDITSFVLTRHSQRVYLTVFLDDYSRYVVSWGIYLHQKQDIVIETLLSGVERFGKPKEVLTDQGRQYFAWRGKSDFQKLLIREGIQHVVARTHHPQTVGKTERFWATVGEEFWERIQPQDLTEAKERFGHFVAHYNHFRPHQGIDGMVPADRFFGVENQVRAAMEKTMDRNELHLALGEKPRKPVFLVGQIGDQQVSMHGERGRLIFQTQDGNLQEMGLEGLGAPGGKDGNGKEGPGSNATGPAEETQSTPQKPEIQAAQERAQTDESVVGLGDGGGKTESSPGGLSDTGELDGPSHATGDSGKTGNTALEGVADVPTSAGGAGGGTLETTQGQEGIGQSSLAPGGGSSSAEKTDSFPGKGLGHDETAGGPVEGIPSPSGVENGD